MFLPQHGIATKCICFYMRGSREGQGVQTPSLIKHKNVGFLSNTGPDPHKKYQKYQASVQCLAIIGPPVTRRLIGVLPA